MKSDPLLRGPHLGRPLLHRLQRQARFVAVSATLAVAAIGSTWAARIEGEVVGVADGDTVTVLDASQVQHRVRLAGIDAPEKRQAFGTKAQQALGSMVFRRVVVLDWQKRDRYGRLVAKVILNGHDVGLDLVSAGLAWHYRAYASEQSAEDRKSYAGAEHVARKKGLGLWVDADPVPPWEFRRARKH